MALPISSVMSSELISLECLYKNAVRVMLWNWKFYVKKVNYVSPQKMNIEIYTATR